MNASRFVFRCLGLAAGAVITTTAAAIYLVPLALGGSFTGVLRSNRQAVADESQP